MTYELAKQLKEAGFPQKEFRYDDSHHIYNSDMSGIAYNPTLSELIEACGDGLISLSSPRSGYWITAGKNGETSGGEDPEEAVAKLWLELNKK